MTIHLGEIHTMLGMCTRGLRDAVEELVDRGPPLSTTLGEEGLLENDRLAVKHHIKKSELKYAAEQAEEAYDRLSSFIPGFAEDEEEI